MSIVRKAIKAAVLRSKVLRVVERLDRASKFVILSYHSIRDADEQQSSFIPETLSHSSEVFEQQLRFLSKTCNVVTLSSIHSHIMEKTKFPSRTVALTFDDGFRDNYCVARPALNAAGIKATFYIASDYIEGPPPWFCVNYVAFKGTTKTVWQEPLSAQHFAMTSPCERLAARRHANMICATLSRSEKEDYVANIASDLGMQGEMQNVDRVLVNWDEVRQLADDGHAIGSHSCSHPNLTRVSARNMVAECNDSRQSIEKNIGVDVEHFAYPNPALDPNWDNVTEAFIRAAGYRTAVTSDSGANTLRMSPFQLRRVHAPGTVADLAWRLEVAFAR
jgi:peptidoglycan/xylan/chitin deacetylase (PgdA/CDA1 family)